MNPEITSKSIQLVVGVAIGLIGTYGWIKKTASPRERVFTLKSAVIGWLIIVTSLVAMQLLGGASAAWLTLLYVAGLIAGMRFVFGKQRRIRLEESKATAIALALATITLALVGCSKKSSDTTVTQQKESDVQVVTSDDGRFVTTTKRTIKPTPATNELSK